MALPGSGTITLAMIAAEFGGSTPHSLSEYYRGGGLVPNTGANAAVPTSGVIRLSNFYGAVATPPSITVGADWGTVTSGGSFQTSGNQTLTVPSGNPGTITFTINYNDATLQYRVNLGSYISVTTGDISIANGDTITFRFSGSSGQSGSVSVSDATTLAAIGTFTGNHT